MHIEINDTTTPREIQEVFSNFYPYLRLEFYSKRHKKYEASDSNNLVDANMPVRRYKPTHVSGILEILPSYKVSDVEKEFQQRFGLSVQVLWKKSREWEQTRGGDDFTLKELNEMSRNSSDEFIVEDYESGLNDSDARPAKLL
jgi:hypothetical protein